MTEISVLTTLGDLRLAKTWLADGTVQDYGDVRTERGTGPKNFRLESREVHDLAGLHALLQELRGRSQSCIIAGQPRAEPAPGAEAARPGCVLRRLDYFEDSPRSWVMFDVDGGGGEGWREDPAEACRAWVADSLPAEFQGVSFVWHLSSSAGHSSKPGLRAHLWFWLAEPRTSAELHAWASAYAVPCDKSLLNPVHIHYTADPIMAEGVVDEVGLLHDRMGFEDGMAEEWRKSGGRVAEVGLVIDAEIVALAAARASSRTGGHVLLDPRTKAGIVGAFCRAFGVEDVLAAAWFKGNFEHARDHRWTWRDGGGTSEGAFVTDDGLHLCNVHDTAPESGRSLNAFDLCRVYNFGELDVDAWADAGNPGRLPSYRAMAELARSLPGVVAEEAVEVAPRTGATSPGGYARTVSLTRASDITPEPIDWLWRGWLAAGKMHVLGGAPGTGKTTISLALAATVTTGGRWQTGRAPRRAMWLSGREKMTPRTPWSRALPWPGPT